MDNEKGKYMEAGKGQAETFYAFDRSFYDGDDYEPQEGKVIPLTLDDAISRRSGYYIPVDLYSNVRGFGDVLSENKDFILIDSLDSVDLYRKLSKESVRDIFKRYGYTDDSIKYLRGKVAGVARELQLEDPAHQKAEDIYFEPVAVIPSGKLTLPSPVMSRQDEERFVSEAVKASNKVYEGINIGRLGVSPFTGRKGENTFLASAGGYAVTYNPQDGYRLLKEVPYSQAVKVMPEQDYSLRAAKDFPPALQSDAFFLRLRDTGKAFGNQPAITGDTDLRQLKDRKFAVWDGGTEGRVLTIDGSTDSKDVATVRYNDDTGRLYSVGRDELKSMTEMCDRWLRQEKGIRDIKAAEIDPLLKEALARRQRIVLSHPLSLGWVISNGEGGNRHFISPDDNYATLYADGAKAEEYAKDPLKHTILASPDHERHYVRLSDLDPFDKARVHNAVILHRLEDKRLKGYKERLEPLLPAREKSPETAIETQPRIVLDSGAIISDMVLKRSGNAAGLRAGKTELYLDMTGKDGNILGRNDYPTAADLTDRDWRKITTAFKEAVSKKDTLSSSKAVKPDIPKDEGRWHGEEKSQKGGIEFHDEMSQKNGEGLLQKEGRKQDESRSRGLRL